MHEKLAGFTRLTAVLSLAVLAWLLVSIKSDLASVVASLARVPARIEVAYHQAAMITLKKCLCSPTVGLITIITVCEPEESPADCRARHLRTIQAWKDAVPDAVECECPD